MKRAEQDLERLVRPWNDEFQLWERPDSAHDAWRLADKNSKLEELAARADYVVLPARQVCSVALWVQTPDETLALESAQLQLEGAGLAGSGQSPQQIETSALRTAGEKTLVRACAFPVGVELPPRPDYAGFPPSPLAIRLPAQALCLWQEGNSVVAAIQDHGKPLLWETFPKGDSSARLEGRLSVLLLELSSQGLLSDLSKIVDFTGTLNGVTFAGLPLERGEIGEGPPPELPEPLPTWAPPAVIEARAASKRRTAMLRGAALGLAALLVLGLFVGIYAAWQQWQIRQLRAEIERLEELVDPTMQIARQWEALAESIEPRHFVLERLLLAVEALPADGVRLSVFEALPDSVRIEGDARNVGLATMFFNTLQSLPDADGYEWTMPPPALQPDNSARFAIDGRPRS